MAGACRAPPGHTCLTVLGSLTLTRKGRRSRLGNSRLGGDFSASSGRGRLHSGIAMEHSNQFTYPCPPTVGRKQSPAFVRVCSDHRIDT